MEYAQQTAIQIADDQSGEAGDVPVLDGLAGHIIKCWNSARTAKQVHVTDRLLRARRARLGEYDPEILAEIKKFGGSEDYGRVISNKCRIAESWLRDVYLGQTEDPWTLKPTPSPDVPATEKQRVRTILASELAQVFALTGEAPAPDIMQSRLVELEDAVQERIRDDARKAVDRMSRKMSDQLAEGAFHPQWGEFLNDFTTYPAAHFKGPIYKMRSVVSWKQKQSGEWKPVVEEKAIPVFERMDPFRCYPSPTATTPQDGYFIEHITFERADLYALIGVEGYSEEAIRAILGQYTYGYTSNWMGFTDTDTVDSESGTTKHIDPVANIDCLEFRGPVPGKLLLEWGLTEDEIDDEDKDYETEAWLIDRWVIKAQLNTDPANRRPIHKSCWEEIPGEYWGQGLPDTLADVSGVTNSAIRALVNNMAMASGPQVGVNVDRLPPGETLSKMHPWRIWQIADSQYGDTSPAISFFQPVDNTQAILATLERFYQFADDWSLIPRYMGGSTQLGEVGRTASGLSMLFSAANKGLKGVVSVIDIKVLTPVLEILYAFNMLYSDDKSIKGDASVVARGAISLMQLETLQLRRNEFLQATANPIDMQIVGVEGRKEVLREVAKGLEMDTNKVVPQKLAQQQPAMPNPGTPPAPNRETLQNGAAVTDNFSPNRLRAI